MRKLVLLTLEEFINPIPLNILRFRAKKTMPQIIGNVRGC